MGHIEKLLNYMININKIICRSKFHMLWAFRAKKLVIYIKKRDEEFNIMCILIAMGDHLHIDPRRVLIAVNYF